MRKIDLYAIHYDNPDRQPMPVGGISHEFVCGLHDKVGEGIPDLATYADMRAPYWIWRNRDDLDIIGFHGYRKFLDLRRPLIYEEPRWHAISLPDFRDYQHWLAQYEGQGILEVLAQYDIIVAPPFDCSYNSNIADDFRISRSPADWEVFKDVMPYTDGEYRDTRHIYPMHFVTRYSVFKRFMEWWWPRAEEIRSRIKTQDSKDGAYSARPMAYLSERIFSLWLDHSGLSMTKVPLLQCWEAK